MSAAVRDESVAQGSGTAELVGDQHASRWDEFINSRSESSAYHLYAWRGVVTRSFGCESYYLATFRGAASPSGDRAISGVLPLLRLKSIFFGDYLVSLPYFNYGGVVAENDAVARELLRGAIDLARSLKVSHMELRHDTNLFPDLPQRTDKVTMVLPLPSDPEVLWKSFQPKLRAQVRRPEKEGAVCVSGGIELLDEFYRVFAENMRDLGTPVYGRSFFSAMLEAFPETARLFIVRLGDDPVAAGFVLGHGGMLQIPWASSLRRANAVGVNMLLYWRILQFACESAYSSFDFGRCSIDAGTHRFKKQWGAQPRQLHWHYWLRSGGELPVINPSNPKYRLVIAAWQKLPLAIANRIGPLLARSLP